MMEDSNKNSFFDLIFRFILGLLSFVKRLFGRSENSILDTNNNYISFNDEHTENSKTSLESDDVEEETQKQENEISGEESSNQEENKLVGVIEDGKGDVDDILETISADKHVEEEIHISEDNDYQVPATCSLRKEDVIQYLQLEPETEDDFSKQDQAKFPDDEIHPIHQSEGDEENVERSNWGAEICRSEEDVGVEPNEENSNESEENQENERHEEDDLNFSDEVAERRSFEDEDPSVKKSQYTVTIIFKTTEPKEKNINEDNGIEDVQEILEHTDEDSEPTQNDELESEVKETVGLMGVENGDLSSSKEDSELLGSEENEDNLDLPTEDAEVEVNNEKDNEESEIKDGQEDSMSSGDDNQNQNSVSEDEEKSNDEDDGRCGDVSDSNDKNVGISEDDVEEVDAKEEAGVDEEINYQEVDDGEKGKRGELGQNCLRDSDNNVEEDDEDDKRVHESNLQVEDSVKTVVKQDVKMSDDGCRSSEESEDREKENQQDPEKLISERKSSETEEMEEELKEVKLYGERDSHLEFLDNLLTDEAEENDHEETEVAEQEAESNQKPKRKRSSSISKIMKQIKSRLRNKSKDKK